MDSKIEPTSNHPTTLFGWIKRENWISILVIILVTSAMMIPVYQFRILNPVNSDFGNHNQYALELLQGKKIPDHILAHPLYQISIDGLIWLTRSRLDADHASILLMAASQVISTLIIYLWMGMRDFRFSEAARTLISIGLTIAAPVMLLQPLDGKFYFGYIGLVNFHNPTIIFLRPLALLMMVLVNELFVKQKTGWLLLLATAIVTCAATLIKPSFTVAVLPCVTFFIGLDWIQKKAVNWKPLLLGVLIPGAFILAAQYLFTYFSAEGSTGQIIFSPFTVEAEASEYLVFKILLSVLFPLVLIASMRKNYFSDRANLIALFTFLIGAGQLYLLAESGNRLEHGNFRWGAQITLFILFVTCMRFFWRKPGLKRSEIIAVVIGFTPHMAAGIIYWLHCLSSKGYG